MRVSHRASTCAQCPASKSSLFRIIGGATLSLSRSILQICPLKVSPLSPLVHELFGQLVRYLLAKSSECAAADIRTCSGFGFAQAEGCEALATSRFTCGDGRVFRDRSLHVVMCMPLVFRMWMPEFGAM